MPASRAALPPAQRRNQAPPSYGRAVLAAVAAPENRSVVTAVGLFAVSAIQLDEL